MSKKRMTCAYCGKTGTKGEGNREHFVPKCLWQGDRPNRTLTVWTHTKCNEQYSEDDEYFRTAILALGECGQHPEAVRIINGTLARLGRTNPGVLRKHFRNLKTVNLETPAGLLVGERTVFSLDVPRLFRVIAKVVKGLFYSKMNRPLPEDHEVTVLWENRETRAAISPIFPLMGETQHFGDDVFIYKWFKFPNEDSGTVCFLGFYKAVSLYAATFPKSDLSRKGGALQFMNVPPRAVWQSKS